MKKHFCRYCECHGDEDMFHVVEWDDRCAICVYNNSALCCHQRVNDSVEIAAKTNELQDLLVDDHRRSTGDVTLELVDLLPSEPVECFTGNCDEDGEPIMVERVLSDTIDDAGNFTLPINDYLRNVTHTEERDSIIHETMLAYDPDAVSKHTDPTNIDYIPTGDAQKDNHFYGSLLHDICIRGFEAPSTREDQIKLLRGCLRQRSRIIQLRNALKIAEIADKHQILDPGQAIPCILHHNNRATKSL